MGATGFGLRRRPSSLRRHNQRHNENAALLLERGVLLVGLSIAAASRTAATLSQIECAAQLTR